MVNMGNLDEDYGLIWIYRFMCYLDYFNNGRDMYFFQKQNTSDRYW